MILNEDLRFESVGSSVKRAFVRVPEKIRLAPGQQFYKWTSNPLLGGRGITPWWSFVESTRLPSGVIAEGFQVAEQRAARLGKTPRDFARARAAVSGQFGNSMSDLLVVSLNLSAWGFVGQASGQREFADDRADLRHVFLIGGAWQVWIPNLESRHLSVVPARA